MLISDLHIHTLHSGHAYGTVYDVIREAKEKGLKLIAITDHGPSMPGTSGENHFEMGARMPTEHDGVRVLWGCEANIVAGNGALDVSPEIQRKLDIVLVNIHRRCGYVDLGRDGNTEAVIRALRNPMVDVLSHPGHCAYEYDIDAVVEEALRNDVLLEINLSYLKAYGGKGLETFADLVDATKTKGARLLVNSDAHFLHEIADDSILDDCRDAIGLEDELILNNFPAELQQFLADRRRSRDAGSRK